MNIWLYFKHGRWLPAARHPLLHSWLNCHNLHQTGGALSAWLWVDTGVQFRNHSLLGRGKLDCLCYGHERLIVICLNGVVGHWDCCCWRNLLMALKATRYTVTVIVSGVYSEVTTSLQWDKVNSERLWHWKMVTLRESDRDCDTERLWQRHWWWKTMTHLTTCVSRQDTVSPCCK